MFLPTQNQPHAYSYCPRPSAEKVGAAAQRSAPRRQAYSSHANLPPPDWASWARAFVQSRQWAEPQWMHAAIVRSSHPNRKRSRHSPSSDERLLESFHCSIVPALYTYLLYIGFNGSMALSFRPLSALDCNFHLGPSFEARVGGLGLVPVPVYLLHSNTAFSAAPGPGPGRTWTMR